MEKIVYFNVTVLNKDYQVFINLREARKNRGFTQTELAELVGCSKNTISSIERGEFTPTLPLIIKLCEVLNYSFDYLFPSYSLGYKKK